VAVVTGGAPYDRCSTQGSLIQQGSGHVRLGARLPSEADERSHPMPDQDPRDPDENPEPAGQPAADQPAPDAAGPYGENQPPYSRAASGQQWATGPVGQPPQTDTGRRTGLFLLLGGGLVLIILIGFLAYSLIGNEGGTDSPEHAVQAFGQAIEDRDCSAAQDVMTNEAAGSFSCDQVDLASLPNIQVSLENIRVTDQSDSLATVKADLTAIGQSVAMTFSVVNEGGAWLIDKVSVNAGGLTGDLSGG
jgi:hypothetical protein